MYNYYMDIEMISKALFKTMGGLYSVISIDKDFTNDTLELFDVKPFYNELGKLQMIKLNVCAENKPYYFMDTFVIDNIKNKEMNFEIKIKDILCEDTTTVFTHIEIM